MSLAVRSGHSALWSVLGLATALPLLPRLPGIVGIPSLFGRAVVQSDSRLEQLKKLLEKNGGVPPFMIDNGAILKAVPKKRPSYRRTREKLYAPGDKQIQPLENLRRCPACGKVKRSHFMCMHCFGEIRAFLKQKKRDLLGPSEPQVTELDPIDERIIYPGKYERADEARMRKKEWIPKREVPLEFIKEQVKKQ